MQPRLVVGVSLFAAAIVAGCGGKVVVDHTGEESDASAGSGGTSGGGSSGDGADGSGGVTTTSNVQASSSTGGPNPCDGSACGAQCTVCNDVECLMGFCGTNQTCEPPTMICQPDNGESCPSAARAPGFLCDGCGGGKGCTFFGCVIGGPEGGDGICCYDVVGGCAPNP